MFEIYKKCTVKGKKIRQIILLRDEVLIAEFYSSRSLTFMITQRNYSNCIYISSTKQKRNNKSLICSLISISIESCQSLQHYLRSFKCFFHLHQVVFSTSHNLQQQQLYFFTADDAKHHIPSMKLDKYTRIIMLPSKWTLILHPNKVQYCANMLGLAT